MRRQSHCRTIDNKVYWFGAAMNQQSPPAMLYIFFLSRVMNAAYLQDVYLIVFTTTKIVASVLNFSGSPGPGQSVQCRHRPRRGVRHSRLRRCQGITPTRDHMDQKGEKYSKLGPF